MKVQNNISAIKNASRQTFKSVDMRERVNSRATGYNRNKEKRTWKKNF
jgi:hypothetical protein